MSYERRRVPRYTAHLKGSLHLPGKGSTLPVLVEDLCVLGCLLEYAPSLQVQQECVLTVEWEGRQFRTPALVAWISQQGEVGLAFYNNDPVNQQLLREICGELRLKPLAPLPQDSE
jgi:hypothetical protein